MSIKVIPTSELAPSTMSVELEGKDHCRPGISLIIVDAPPGAGPALHTHEYAEIMVVLEGTVTFTDGVTSQEVGSGHVVIVPAGDPHAFTNTGEGRLRQIDIHVSDAFSTTWHS